MLLVPAALLVLLGITYAVSVAGLRLFSHAEASRERRDQRRAHPLDVYARDPRRVLLAAELFNLLVFICALFVVVWAVPRWCRLWGWPALSVTGASVILLWLARFAAAHVLPKRWSPQDDAPISTGHLPGLAVIDIVFGPLVAALEWVLQVRRGPRRPLEREEIVERAIDTLAESAGMSEPVIEADERAMIQGVIGLENTEVREVMVPRVDIVAVDVHATVADVRRRTSEYGHSRLPVYDGDLDTIVGVLYIKDLFCAQPAGDADLSALTRRAFVVPETKKVDALMEEFRRTRTHIAIVVDEFGGTAGLVTLEDILEEIVGEIEDEHERRRRPAIERESDGVLHVDGVVPLKDIAEALDIELSDDRFETIGGLIYDRVGGVPRVGQSFDAHGLAITIEQVDGQRIRRVRVARRGAADRES